MKHIGIRTYRGVILTPVIGGWNYRTIGYDAAGQRYDYQIHTRSLEAAKVAIAAALKSGYFAAWGAIAKQEIAQ